MKKTVSELAEDVKALEEKFKSGVEVHGALVWNTQQVKDLLDKYDDDNGIVKVEITHGFEPGKKCYRVHIERYHRIDN